MGSHHSESYLSHNSSGFRMVPHYLAVTIVPHVDLLQFSVSWVVRSSAGDLREGMGGVGQLLHAHFQLQPGPWSKQGPDASTSKLDFVDTSCLLLSPLP